jgi:hypothetical protein
MLRAWAVAVAVVLCAGCAPVDGGAARTGALNAIGKAYVRVAAKLAVVERGPDGRVIEIQLR